MTPRVRNSVQTAACILILLLTSACLKPEELGAASSSSSSATTQATLTVPDGAKAVKILFSGSAAGSFDSADVPPTSGNGILAKRFFTADSTISSGTELTQPDWIESVEIGISGGTNTDATNANCARFAAVNEDTTTLCDFDNDATADVACGAGVNLYRVSEFDCAGSTTSDGVYIHVRFNRDASVLGEQENISAVLEYSASALNPAPTNPTDCFAGGEFTPTNAGCSDMVWQMALELSSGTVLPYLMLVPPSVSYVDQDNNRGGGAIASRQFQVPLAGDSRIVELQINRESGLSSTAPFNTICSSNSAHCVGMVFYSLTLYRI